MALALFVLGLLSKTVTATLPAALLVVFWWQRGRLSWRRDVLPLLPLFLLGAAAGVLTAQVEYKLIGAQGAEYQFTLIERFLIAGRVVWFYLGKLFWPADLIFIYPRWNVSQAVWWQYLFPLAALLLLVLLWVIRRGTRAPLAGLLFFGGTLFPVLGFFNVFPFRFSLVADHFQYLASLGIITLGSAGAALLLRWERSVASPPAPLPRRKRGVILRRLPTTRWVGGAICLALLLTLAALSWQQSKMYVNVDTLLRTTLKRNPACSMAHHNLGFLLADLGKTDEAIDHYRQALRLGKSAEIHLNLGIALAVAGRSDEAVEQFDRALRLKPGHAEAHNHLGAALDSLGRTSEAIEHYQQALRLSPGQARFHDNLGNALLKLGKRSEAIQQYREALRLQPDFPVAHYNLAIVLADLGRTSEAIGHYRQALQLDPSLAGAHNNLALCLARLGRTREAIGHYRQALRLKADDAKTHYNFGNLLAATGQPDEAFAHFEQVLRLGPRSDLGQRALAAALATAAKSRKALEYYNQILDLAPDSAQALNNLAWLLATHEPAEGGDAARAIRLAQRARELAGQENPQCLDTLAAAYASAGRFEDAVLIAEQAVPLAESTGQTALAKNIQSRLDLYRTDRPYRETHHPNEQTEH